jgi:hypothetical protein
MKRKTLMIFVLLPSLALSYYFELYQFFIGVCFGVIIGASLALSGYFER